MFQIFSLCKYLKFADECRKLLANIRNFTPRATRGGLNIFWCRDVPVLIFILFSFFTVLIFEAYYFAQ